MEWPDKEAENVSIFFIQLMPKHAKGITMYLSALLFLQHCICRKRPRSNMIDDERSSQPWILDTVAKWVESPFGFQMNTMKALC